jgi:hypothetical protein
LAGELLAEEVGARIVDLEFPSDDGAQGRIVGNPSIVSAVLRSVELALGERRVVGA